MISYLLYIVTRILQNLVHLEVAVTTYEACVLYINMSMIAIIMIHIYKLFTSSKLLGFWNGCVKYTCKPEAFQTTNLYSQRLCCSQALHDSWGYIYTYLHASCMNFQSYCLWCGIGYGTKTIKVALKMHLFPSCGTCGNLYF